MSDIIEKLGITPGPWEWRKHNGLDSSALFYGDDDTDIILDDGSAHDEYYAKIDPKSANGRLIAAAPEMLKALIEDCRVDDLHFEADVYKQFDKSRYNNRIKIIEKACHPLKWNGLKELI